MLYGLFDGQPFLLMWLLLAVFGCAWYMLICGGLYLFLHRSRHSESLRRWKTQRRPPNPTQVRGEIFDGLLSMSMVMCSIALSFWCAQRGYGGLYADPAEYGLLYVPVSVFLVFVTMEIFEWTFHWACHNNDWLYKIHKHHHRYSNPTSFGVMADQPLDMLIKASPILWMPFLFPVWDVALLVTFATMNFLYGTYLHAGFDFPFMASPHSRFLVTSWHHNEHHSGSPQHNFGFFTGMLDTAFGTRFTPTDKAARRPGHRCPECRNLRASPHPVG